MRIKFNIIRSKYNIQVSKAFIYINNHQPRGIKEKTAFTLTTRNKYLKVNLTLKMSKISILKIYSAPEGHKIEAQNKWQGKLHSCWEFLTHCNKDIILPIVLSV